MSQAQNLLNNLVTTADIPEISTTPVNDVLTIDAEGRITYVPNTEILLGVETDQDVERKYFKCPKIVGDNIDLSKLQLLVKYQNAEGRKDKYPVDDVSVNGEYIEFSWLLSEKVLAAKGVVYFAIQAVSAESDGTIKNRWNTTLASGTVLETLNVDDLDDYEEEQARDILTQLLQMMDDKYAESIQNIQKESATQISNIQTAGAAQVKAVEDKGIAILDSIPDDYESTYVMAEEANRTKADAIKLDANGESITLIDASEDPVRGLKLFGKSSQVTTTGAQLADFSDLEPSNGVTTKFVDDTLTVVGDGSLTYQYAQVSITDVAKRNGGKTLYFHYDSLSSTSPLDGSVIQLNIIFTDDTIKYTGLVTKDKTFVGYTIPTDVNTIQSMNLAVYPTNAATATANTITIKKPMLHIGSAKVPYEPYSGGYASPSVNWSQDMVSLGDKEPIIAGTLGSNIIDLKSLEMSSVTGLYVSDDGYTVKASGGTKTGWSSAIYELPSDLVKMLRGKKIYSTCDSYESEQEINTRAGFNVTLDDGTTVYPASVGAINTAVTETINKRATKIIFSVYANNSGKQLETENTVTIKGLRVTLDDYQPWEQHTGVQSMSITNILRAVPVTSGGNYTDSNGRQWIADYIDCERGNLVQCIGHYTFDGSDDEGWHAPQTVDETCRCCTTILSDISTNHAVGDIANILCNQFTPISAIYTFAEEKQVGIAVQGAGNPALFVYHEDYNTSDISVWVNHLKEHPMTVFYELAQPTITPLTAEQIHAFKTLHTHYPNTVVLNSVDAFMELKYNTDTKEYLDQYIKTSEPFDAMLMKDTTTGKIYRVSIVNGSLQATEVID